LQQCSQARKAAPLKQIITPRMSERLHIVIWHIAL
jgi:hypothetical protein